MSERTRGGSGAKTYRIEVGDGGVSETQDAINGVAAEGAGEGGHGREGLGLDRDAGDGDGVGVDGARDGRAIAVLDGERAALLGGRRGGACAVPALRLASRAGAGGAGDPEVGRAGVEVDEELLSGGADGDRAGPLLVVVLVGKGLGLALGEVVGKHSEGLDLSALLEDVRAHVLLEVDQVRTVLAAGLRQGGRTGASALLVYVIGNIKYILEGLHRLDDGLVVVESAISVGERRALLEGNADARLGGDRARRRHEGEGDSEQRGLAEHDERCEKSRREPESSANCSEQEKMSW